MIDRLAQTVQYTAQQRGAHRHPRSVARGDNFTPRLEAVCVVKTHDLGIVIVDAHNFSQQTLIVRGPHLAQFADGAGQPGGEHLAYATQSPGGPESAAARGLLPQFRDVQSERHRVPPSSADESLTAGS